MAGAGERDGLARGGGALEPAARRDQHDVAVDDVRLLEHLLRQGERAIGPDARIGHGLVVEREEVGVDRAGEIGKGARGVGVAGVDDQRRLARGDVGQDVVRRAGRIADGAAGHVLRDVHHEDRRVEVAQAVLVRAPHGGTGQGEDAEHQRQQDRRCPVAPARRRPARDHRREQARVGRLFPAGELAAARFRRHVEQADERQREQPPWP